MIKFLKRCIFVQKKILYKNIDIALKKIFENVEDLDFQL